MRVKRSAVPLSRHSWNSRSTTTCSPMPQHLIPPPPSPSRICAALVVMLACGIAMYTTGSGVMPTVLVLAVQLCATLYAAIVVWNPSVHSLVTGQTVFLHLKHH